MADDSLFLIDIDRILREKAPKQSKYVPRFVVSYLKHIVHQDELNVFLRESKDKVGVDFLEACLEFLDAKIEVKGRENLPDDRLCTFVSNHPLGGQDGISLGYILGRHYDGKVKYLVNDLLMNLHGLAPLCIPINKTGRQAKDFPKLVEAGFASDNQLIMFPAGLCSRRQKGGVIADLDWKKAFIVKSVEHQRDVVPIHFEGRNSNFFLQPGKPVQVPGNQVQHRHVVSGRRNAEKPTQDLYRNHRETHSLANVRQVEDTRAMGTVCKGYRI